MIATEKETIYCGSCGEKLVPKGLSGFSNKTGEKLFYIQCPNNLKLNRFLQLTRLAHPISDFMGNK